jgi:hypothetical protein
LWTSKPRIQYDDIIASSGTGLFVSPQQASWAPTGDGNLFKKVQMSKDEVAKYLTHEERQSINSQEKVPGQCTLERQECCLGASSGGAGSLWKAGQCPASKGVRYDERFQLITPDGPKKMNDLADALDRAPASITWMGDSVLNQVWNAASCELHRKPGKYEINVTNFKGQKIPTIDTFYGWAVGAQTSAVVDASASERTSSIAATDLQLASAMSAQHGQRTVEMEFFRAYRPLTASNATFEDIDSSALGSACATSEILISNFGVHWDHAHEEDFEKQMGRLLDYLSYCVKRGGRLKTFIWIEPLPQHFVGPDGTYHSFQNALGHNTYTTEQIEWFARARNMSIEELKVADCKDKCPLDKCFPHLHIDRGTHNTSWRSILFQKAVRDRGMQVGGAVAQSIAPALKLFVLPTHDFMSDLHYMHPGECTHWCYTPFLYEPLWHRLHDIFDAVNSPAKKHR